MNCQYMPPMDFLGCFKTKNDLVYEIFQEIEEYGIKKLAYNEIWAIKNSTMTGLSLSAFGVKSKKWYDLVIETDYISILLIKPKER